MTPLFSPTAPWTSRALVLTSLICLPVAGLVIREASLHQSLEREIIQAEQRLIGHQRILHQLQEVQQRRQRQSHQLAMVPQGISMLDSIGSALSPDIALLSIDINATKHDARLTVNATSLSTLLAFSERLQQLPANVVLESHRSTANGGTDWPISASLNVRVSAGDRHASGK